MRGDNPTWLEQTSAAAHHSHAWVPRELFPFESRFLEIDGHVVHYVDEGSGPTLLLLHGNPTWSFIYRDIIKRLAPAFRCVALDYPGFGLSAAARGYDYRPRSHAHIVEEFVRRLQLGSFTLFVQDWGGPIGLWVAGRHPARIRALVIGNTWAWPITGDKHFETFSKVMGGAVGRFGINNFNAFVNVLIPLGIRRQRVSRIVMDAYRGPFRERAARKATWIFPREIVASADFLREVELGLPLLADLPALLLWGDCDAAFRSVERQRFESTFRRHRTHVLHGAGHYIQEDAAEEIVRAIENWWERDVVVDSPGKDGDNGGCRSDG